MVGPDTPFSQALHAQKYRSDGESFDDYTVRYARTVADSKEHFRHLLEALRGQRILPGGRQQLDVGRPFLTTAFSCFVGGTIPDDLRAIMNEFTDSMMTLRSGGGCGWNFSTLRPEHEPVRRLGPGAYASGPVSFMNIWNAGCSTIMSAGMRRGAMMGVLNVSHPDILKFIRAKRQPGELTNFNISVGISHKFMEAVYADGLFNLEFEGRVFSQVRAVDLWAPIMESNWDWAEPGVLFLDRINEMNPLAYLEYIASTNPCVPGDTEILTDQGYRPIAECVGNNVKVWNGERWSVVSPSITGLQQPLVEVELSNGATIRCTPTHKFILEDGSRIAAQDLQDEQVLAEFDFPIVCADRERAVSTSWCYTQGIFAGDGCWNGRMAEVWLYGEKKRLLPYLESEWVNEFSSASEETRLQVSLGSNHLAKDWVPGAETSVAGRLAWFAGLCDTDGVAVRNRKANGEWSSTGIQVASIDHNFLLRTRKMLTTLGIETSVGLMHEARESLLPDGKGGQKLYQCQPVWRLKVAASAVWKLQKLGLLTRRLKLGDQEPQREARRKLRVVAVRPGGVAAVVYCFTEPHAHRGVFEGVVTGQCSEQPLPPHGACLLGSLNLVKYLVPTYARASSNGKNGHHARPVVCYELDMDLFRKDARAAVRAFDQVIDVTTYPLPQQEKEAKDKRRMGVGVSGVANALEVMGHPYGTVSYLEAQDVLGEALRDACYEESIKLAQEKGPFPLFDADKWLASGFAKTLPEELRDKIRRYGLRNGLLLSVAPTGTISLTADNISSGIEPIVDHSFTRTINTMDGPTEVEIEDYAYRNYGVKGLTASSIAPADHVRVLCGIQKFIDSSVSKTITVRGAVGGQDPEPGEITFDEFKDVYLAAYAGGAKGCTTYNENGKRKGIIQPKRTKQTIHQLVAVPAGLTGEVSAATYANLAEAGGACTYDANGQKTCG